MGLQLFGVLFLFANILFAQEVLDEQKLIQTTQKQLTQAHNNLSQSIMDQSVQGYTIQLLSATKDFSKQIEKKFENLPQVLKQDSIKGLFGSHLAIRYGMVESKKDALEYLEIAKKNGYNDAYMVKMSQKKFQTILSQIHKPHLNESAKNKNPQDAYNSDDISGYEYGCISKQSFSFEPLNSYDFSQTLTQAHQYKQTNQIEKSIHAYEKLFAHKQSNETINNNLFYLYGTTNNWPKANEKLCLINNKSKVLYSYALGALQINNPMLEDDLLGVLSLDTKGYVHLALAVFFEHNENNTKAHQYFKKAYDINRYDLYLAFAYARSCEIMQEYKKALFLYKLMASSRDLKYQQIQKNSQTRYDQLRMLSIEEGVK